MAEGGNVLVWQSAKLCEHEAALKIELFLRQELGLSPKETTAALVKDILTVRLYDALTPIGRLISHSDEGEEILPTTYSLLHQLCQEQLHRRAASIIGRTVIESRIEVDSRHGNVTLMFVLGGPWPNAHVGGK